jgi:hypothetical protein
MNSKEIQADIRALLSRIFRNSPGVRVVEELEICGGKARADMAVISDELIGIEIKGPKDKLDRLPGQIQHYSRCFDRVILVADEVHLPEANALVPSWWGMVSIARENVRNRYAILRRPNQNPDVDAAAMLALLWRSEIEGLFLRVLGNPAPAHLSKQSLRGILLSRESMLALKTATIKILRARQEWRSFSIHSQSPTVDIRSQSNVMVDTRTYP